MQGIISRFVSNYFLNDAGYEEKKTIFYFIFPSWRFSFVLDGSAEVDEIRKFCGGSFLQMRELYSLYSRIIWFHGDR